MYTDERNAIFSPKDPAEVVTLNFDFTVFGVGWTSPTITCAHYSGVADSAAASMVTSSPAVVENGVISQDIQAGVNNADYLIRCSVTRGMNIYVISGILPVRTAIGGWSQSEILD